LLNCSFETWGAYLRFELERISLADRFYPGHRPLQELIVDRLVNQRPGRRRANLALIEGVLVGLAMAQLARAVWPCHLSAPMTIQRAIGASAALGMPIADPIPVSIGLRLLMAVIGTADLSPEIHARAAVSLRAQKLTHTPFWLRFSKCDDRTVA
jgi:hypothetical protein